MVLKRGELEKIFGNDINIYFQLAVEMFDYLDEIVGKDCPRSVVLQALTV